MQQNKEVKTADKAAYSVPEAARWWGYRATAPMTRPIAVRSRCWNLAGRRLCLKPFGIGSWDWAGNIADARVPALRTWDPARGFNINPAVWAGDGPSQRAARRLSAERLRLTKERQAEWAEYLQRRRQEAAA